MSQRQDATDDASAIRAGLAHELRNAAFGLTSGVQWAAAEMGISPTHPALARVEEFERRVDAVLRDHELLVGPLPLRPEAVALAPMADAACDTIVRAGGQRPSLVDLPSPAHVWCDEEATTRALEVLMVAAGALSARVDVTLHAESTRASVQVRGPGIGGPPERWFEPFARTCPLGSRLSYAVAKRRILAQGGELRVEVADDATIAATLPLAR